ncbi:C-C chemokine receptor type 4 isoform X2 [Malaclemys terrapin pileata]|uniref:C-C chemokine receptor type 4 isoform X2 n=1 Tax=Malaclemys terrapin pileata TaxID=2991368 RepID=UPI0023A7F56C|nr:C-C chemokine receptor type 4 isoform X2 [Malaclemys terrapin pileata]
MPHHIHSCSEKDTDLPRKQETAISGKGFLQINCEGGEKRKWKMNNQTTEFDDYSPLYDTYSNSYDDSSKPCSKESIKKFGSHFLPTLYSLVFLLGLISANNTCIYSAMLCLLFFISTNSEPHLGGEEEGGRAEINSHHKMLWKS